MAEFSFRFFDRSDDYSVVERRLPHWLQIGTLTFIAFRTDDSLPRHVIEEWKNEQSRLLLEQGIESISLNPDSVVETWLALAGKRPAV